MLLHTAVTTNPKGTYIMNSIIITRNVAAKLIKNTKGKVFSAKFMKKDQTERVMNCRLDVKKYLKGGASTTAHCTNLVTVYDMQNMGYRCINLDTLISIRANGNEYKVA